MDLPVLTDKDIFDLKEFACKHKVDYVAASFVQSAADVCFIRSVLDDGGGFDIKIISKIENQEGLNNFKEVWAIRDHIGGNFSICIPEIRPDKSEFMHLYFQYYFKNSVRSRIVLHYLN